MIDCTKTIPTEGNRIAHAGSYTVHHDDGEPERRVFISTGWAGMPLLPFARETVDLPASALPALIAALEAVEVET